MWANPVTPAPSWADPTLTRVIKANTGATGRSTRINVHPFFRVCRVTRFSNDSRFCPKHIEAERRRRIKEERPKFVARILLLDSNIIRSIPHER